MKIPFIFAIISTTLMANLDVAKEKRKAISLTPKKKGGMVASEKGVSEENCVLFLGM